MKYLLSDGSATKDIIVYIKDLFKLNLLIRLKEVPYWTGGSNDLIKVLKSDEVESEITELVKDVVNKLQSSVKSVSISFESIEITNSIVRINITINGVIESYDIKRINS